MSLGTTLRLPLGNRVEVIDVRRLGKKKREKQREYRYYIFVVLIIILFFFQPKNFQMYVLMMACSMLITNVLPLCCSVAFTLYSDHVDPQQAIE